MYFYIFTYTIDIEMQIAILGFSVKRTYVLLFLLRTYKARESS